MSYLYTSQYSSQGLPNFTPNLVSDSKQIYLKNYSNSNFNQASNRQNKSYLYNYEIQKAFMTKDKQWMNSLKNPQPNNLHNVVGNTITKPNSSSLAEQKRSKVDSAYQFEQNLAKTVKHSVVPYKRVQPQINPEYFKASSIYGEPPRTVQQSQNVESRASKIISSNNGASQKHSIMSIDQIRDVEKKQFSDKTIHKITSSASRNKLKTSSLKDSKGSSVNVQAKSIKLNGQTERYNKYINNEMININIDLRKEPPKNIIVPNLNVRRFGGSEPLQSQYQTIRLENYPHQNPIQLNQISRVVVSSQAYYPQAVPAPNLMLQKKQSQNDELTCKDSVPRQDKDLPQRIKTRSKSNLSRYSQLKQENPHAQCLIHCQQKVDPSKLIQPEIVMHQTHEKSLKRQSPPLQKSQKKINFISYSSIDKNPQKATQTNPNSNQNYQTQTLAHQLSKDSKRQEVQKIAISFSGIKKNQQLKRPQTQRKSITNFNIYPCSDVQGESNGLSQLIEEKMKKKPIRLTLHKRY